MRPSRAVPAGRAGRSRRVGTNRDAHAPGFYARAFEVQAFGEQLVGCDGGPHSSASPYPARRSLTVRPVHQKRDRNQSRTSTGVASLAPGRARKAYRLVCREGLLDHALLRHEYAAEFAVVVRGHEDGLVVDSAREGREKFKFMGTRGRAGCALYRSTEALLAPARSRINF